MTQKNIFAVNYVDYNGQEKLNAENKGVFGKTINCLSDYFLAALQLADYTGSVERSGENFVEPEQFAKLLSESGYWPIDADVPVTKGTIRMVIPKVNKIFHIWVGHNNMVTVVYHVAETFDSDADFDMIAWRDGKRLGDLNPACEEDLGRAIDWLHLAAMAGEQNEVVVPTRHPLANCWWKDFEGEEIASINLTEIQRLSAKHHLPGRTVEGRLADEMGGKRISSAYGANGTAVHVTDDSAELNRFYPLSDTISNCPDGMWQIGMTIKLQDHLRNAADGNRDSESRLVNRIGQLRRHFPEMNGFNMGLYIAVSEAVGWLAMHGRAVDLTNADPAKWISQRGGAPRWK